MVSVRSRIRVRIKACFQQLFLPRSTCMQLHALIDAGCYIPSIWHCHTSRMWARPRSVITDGTPSSLNGTSLRREPLYFGKNSDMIVRKQRTSGHYHYSPLLLQLTAHSSLFQLVTGLQATAHSSLLICTDENETGDGMSRNQAH